MLALLPLLAFVGLLLLLGNVRPSWGWRRSFLRAALLWGGWALLATEAVSLLQGITPAGLALVWAVPVLACGVLLARQAMQAGRLALPRVPFPDNWPDRGLWLAVLGIVCVTALIAWLAPPQTWDSLNYHMSRVAHWAQQHSLRPFATGIEVQNSRSPGAEILVLQFYVLAAGDRLVNFVEWLAMVGSLVGAAMIAQQLGGSRPAQLLAVVVTATIPMGIAQASSTMTDYVVAFWVICAVSECLASLGEAPPFPGVAFAGLGAGLALVTKPTAAAYLAPFALWVAWAILRRQGLRRLAGQGLAAAAFVVLLNAGPLIRNAVIYGTPLDPAQVSVHSNLLGDPRALLSNLLRNLALNAGTPSTHVNKAIYLAIVQIHEWIGLDPNDPRTTSAGEFKVRVPGPYLGEDQASNSFHAWLYLGVLAVLLLRRRTVGRHLLGYGLAVSSTLVLLSWIFKWQIFGGRYQLPLFVLFAPVAALVVTGLFSARGAGTVMKEVKPGEGTGESHPEGRLLHHAPRIVGALLILASWPWLAGMRSRPLIPARVDPVVGSVLEEPRVHLYFANGLYLEPIYTSMASMVREAGCPTVGLMLPGNSAEYLLWMLLGAPRNDLEIEWIVADTPSARFEQASFQPCAVICEGCPQGWDLVRGLPVVYGSSTSDYRLYLGSPPGG
jgi:hypothetical protein